MKWYRANKISGAEDGGMGPLASFSHLISGKSCYHAVYERDSVKKCGIGHLCLYLKVELCSLCFSELMVFPPVGLNEAV